MKPNILPGDFSENKNKLTFVYVLLCSLIFIRVLFFYKDLKPKDKSNCHLYCTEIGGTVLTSSSSHVKNNITKELECHCTVLNSDSTQIHLNLAVKSSTRCPKVGDVIRKARNSFNITMVDQNGENHGNYDMKRGCE